MNCMLKAYEQEAQRSAAQTRDELIVNHLPLVKFLVGRIASQLPPHLDQEDLMSAAIIGLITAAERFDPARGVQFKTFAEQRIRGTIIDELRSQDWLTRSLRDKFKKLEKEFVLLEHRLGRNPTSEEVATALKMSVDEYYQMLEEIHLLSFVSLNESWEDDDGSPFGLLDILADTSIENPQSQLMARQMLDSLTESIESLPEKERLVITLYYYEELNLKEIGAVLELSESRISQLHSQAIVRLRAKMKNMR
ncbi:MULTISPECIES: FliA/WhiG family RNA polymerase sigma factor [Geobacter]|uniref:RNA polymerase sigma factor WhiG n=2 Tax=Geobacter TaxID=28231 RepID=A0A0C1TRJ9_9BACT|nr:MULTISPECIES: FliA/WhiG family RNA polymerase sigma factor [Geobacter]ANA41240.1 RNA polymerase subunit sigma [Geobacter anodireducens]KIE43384.1 RNA polymerase sigma factor WhiG [Geobacter soli]MBE2887778.1 FliA/WhiG family RNA polymerase sigma factor [Geobacter anodireducens]HMN01774.1 FliA/WhiG family RNA polymerase sigma factor [Geobacter anodireducens]